MYSRLPKVGYGGSDKIGIKAQVTSKRGPSYSRGCLYVLQLLTVLERFRRPEEALAE